MEKSQLNFKEFFTESHKEFLQDAKKTMLKIPNSHKELVKNYKINPEGGNTLDGGHVGEIDEKSKKIKIASPWNYGRVFTFLHEIAHAVWKYVLDDNLKKQWHSLYKKCKKQCPTGLDQGSEESFCMLYAQHYAKNKLVKFDHPNKELDKFIANLPK